MKEMNILRFTYHIINYIYLGMYCTFNTAFIKNIHISQSFIIMYPSLSHRVGGNR